MSDPTSKPVPSDVPVGARVTSMSELVEELVGSGLLDAATIGRVLLGTEVETPTGDDRDVHLRLDGDNERVYAWVDRPKPNHPLVHVNELSADEAEALGHDSTLRGELGPLVKVTVSHESGHTFEQVGVLVEARINPEQLDEV